MSPNENMKEKLKVLRIQAGLSRQELAEKLENGYTEKVVSAIESGERNIGWNIIQTWANACGFDANVVFVPLLKSNDI